MRWVRMPRNIAVIPGWTRPDIPFARDEANRLLPWIIGCMAGLAALMLALAATLHTDIAGRHNDYRRTVTVQLPPDMAADTKRAGALLKALSNLDGVTDAELLDKSEVKQRVSPWFSDPALVDTLPLPTVIDITLSSGSSAETQETIAQLKERIGRDYPGADFDAHEAWTEHLGSFARFIEITAGAMAVLMLGAMAAIIVLSTRTAFRLHLRTVKLLHRFGATDDYILRQFQSNAALLALKGALPGVLLAAALYGVMMAMSLSYFAFSLLLLLLWLVLPPLTVMIALAAAWWSVRSILYALP
jgi:cell division transport system permease protein